MLDPETENAISQILNGVDIFQKQDPFQRYLVGILEDVAIGEFIVDPIFADQREVCKYCDVNRPIVNPLYQEMADMDIIHNHSPYTNCKTVWSRRILKKMGMPLRVWKITLCAPEPQFRVRCTENRVLSEYDAFAGITSCEVIRELEY